ncbi:MAG: TIGR01777 family oxidoreductase [Bacteroidota bacterium]
MIIAISGAGGFIGKQLSKYFQSKGNEVKSIPRVNIDTQAADIAKLLQGVDVVINLAGAPIVARWTKAYKKTLFDSRIITTSKIVEAIGLLDKKPELLISASAVGIYSQEREQTEGNYKKADDYLGEICSAWETEARKAIPFTRLAIARFGIVLGKDGGALERMLPLFRLGLGGKIASGKQGFSWIHIYDVFQAVEFIIQNKKLSGEFSFTAPEVVDNKQFTNILAKILRKPALFTVPAFALKLVFGEGAIAVTGGQFAPPKHLINEGFRFSFPELNKALKEII